MSLSVVLTGSQGNEIYNFYPSLHRWYLSSLEIVSPITTELLNSFEPGVMKTINEPELV
jgi:hypothetical protein